MAGAHIENALEQGPLGASCEGERCPREVDDERVLVSLDALLCLFARAHPRARVRSDSMAFCACACLRNTRAGSLRMYARARRRHSGTQCTWAFPPTPHPHPSTPPCSASSCTLCKPASFGPAAVPPGIRPSAQGTPRHTSRGAAARRRGMASRGCSRTPPRTTHLLERVRVDVARPQALQEVAILVAPVDGLRPKLVEVV